MENKSKNLLIKSILIISAVIFLVIIIYFYISFKKTKEETNRERVFTYLTTTYKNASYWKIYEDRIIGYNF